MKEVILILRHYFLGFILCLVVGCNTNEVFTIQLEDDRLDELPTIESSQIETSFNPNTRQILQFTTDASADNIGNLYFYSSNEISLSNPNITDLIILFHGLSASDADLNREYNSLINAVGSTTSQASTLVLAPHFFHIGEGIEIDWDNAVWKEGGRASSPAGVSLSSAQIVDYLLEEYFLENPNFPNLQNTLIVGHSAGGQFAQRYAAISRIENTFPSYTFHYLPSNASHYLYLNDQRWNGSDLFRPTGCTTYNEYPYGLDSLTKDNRYSFLSEIGLETIRQNYIRRKLYYVLGNDDISGATTDCESQSQQGGTGESRFTRGQFLFAYMNELYPANEHELLTIPGVGHSTNGIYNSAAFITLLDNLLD